MPSAPRIGLTGGIGSGKSTLAHLLQGLGAGLVDSDAIAREITGPGGAAIDAIRRHFGTPFIGADGALDRARMRAHVLADPARRQALEALLHPLIRDEGDRRAAVLASSTPYVLFDIPLLAESPGSERRFDRVLVVDCPVALQVERVIRRGSIDRAQAEAILAIQAGRERRLAIADDIVFNAAGAEDLRRSAGRLHQRYLALRRAGAAL